MKVFSGARIATCILTVLVCAATMAAAQTDAIEPAEKTMLFDGRTLDGWVVHPGGEGADAETPWSVGGNGTLVCKGEPRGYIRTAKPYANYKLHLEYRWLGKPGNNGILVHMTGEDKVWPRSLECQGQFRNQGDFFEIGGFGFNAHQAGGKRVRGRRVLKYGKHNEKEAGRWNVYEVWCVGDVVRPYVNGRLMNEATGCAVTAGRICLQSEGSPIEFRNIYVAPPENKPWPVSPRRPIDLFNGRDLTGWVPFIPDDKADEDGKWQVDKVWSVRDGVLHCTGKPGGYIRTAESYADYRLHLEWRWPGEPTNSGVLLHRQGMDRVWPKAIEAQLKNGRAGDFVLLSESTIEIDGEQVGPGKYPSAPRKHDSNEKPAGEWNTYDIVCRGDAVELTVNGQVQNTGLKATPSSGPICLQSEGGPIEFRNIRLEPLGDD